MRSHQRLLQQSTIQDVLNEGVAQYKDHNERIKKLCKDQGRPCLEFNVKQGYQPLCDYLNEPIPVDPTTGKTASFPRRNDSSTFQKMDHDLRGFMRLLVAINVVCSAVGIAALAFGLDYARRRGGITLPGW
ncbi:MAG: hypothetical protein Q9162_002913 [Coniocarpon cinnabarinum]